MNELSLRMIEISNKKLEESDDCKWTMISRDNPSAKLKRVKMS